MPSSNCVPSFSISTSVVPSGTLSVTSTFVALAYPVFSTVIVYSISSPGATFPFAELDFLYESSGFSSSFSVSTVACFSSVSSSFAVAVFNIFPSALKSANPTV